MSGENYIGILIFTQELLNQKLFYVHISPVFSWSVTIKATYTGIFDARQTRKWLVANHFNYL